MNRLYQCHAAWLWAAARDSGNGSELIGLCRGAGTLTVIRQRERTGGQREEAFFTRQRVGRHCRGGQFRVPERRESWREERFVRPPATILGLHSADSDVG